MSSAETTGEGLVGGETPSIRSRGPWARALRRFRRQPLAVAALVLLLVIFGAGALATKVAPYGYSGYNLDAIPPLAPTRKGNHFFGTDEIGRDTFSRTLYGIRTSAEVSLSVAVLASLLGVLIGGLAGYYGGWIDNVLMRIVDFLVTIPALVLLFTTIVYFGVPSPLKIGVILTLYLWTAVARVVRGSFASLREAEYVEAARAAGASDGRIILRHLLPNAAGSIIVAATLLVGQVILLESTVEFFEYGIDQNAVPSLGNLVADSVKNEGLGSPWWWLYLMPASFIVAMIMCVNFVGDSLDEALNPR